MRVVVGRKLGCSNEVRMKKQAMKLRTSSITRTVLTIVLSYIFLVIGNDAEAAQPMVSAGYYHTIGLKSDGTVVAVGRNNDGECDVTAWSDIVAVTAGGLHTVGLKSDGTVVAVGRNNNGECDVTAWSDIVAVTAGGYHTVGLKSDGTVVAVGRNNLGECDVTAWSDIVAVTAGCLHTVGLKSDGTVVAVGWNDWGECDVTAWSDIVAVAAGGQHTVGLKSDGTVVAVGWDGSDPMEEPSGQLNVSAWSDIVAVAAGEQHTIGLKSDGTVVAVGRNNLGECDVTAWSDIVAVAAVNYNTVGLRYDGWVYAVGYNSDGQCDVFDWNLGYSHATGTLAVGIEPSEARNAGAQWRVDGGAWHNSNYIQRGLATGYHTVEFKTLVSWTRPASRRVMIYTDLFSRLNGAYSTIDFENGTLQGIVTGQDGDGLYLGALQDVSIDISGFGSTSTNSQGGYSLSGIPPGDYSITASKVGYYTEEREVTIRAGATHSEHFRLTQVQSASRPSYYNFDSPDGNVFVPGMAGAIQFATNIDWQGSPGSVRFLVNGLWHAATITDLGGGLAKAVLNIAAPSIIDDCSELTIEITNGEGTTHTVNMGVHFYPLIGAIPWYQDDISWVSGELSLSDEISKSWVFDLTLPSDDFDLDASLGFGVSYKYDLLAATLSSLLAGEGGLAFKIPTPQPGFKVLGGASLNIAGNLSISLAGCETPSITPSWSLGFGGKAGVEAPAVLLLDAVAPGVGSSLSSIPKINDIKLQFFVNTGGALSAKYTDGQIGECLLGSTATQGSITGGLKAQAQVDFTKEINAGIYVGGDGTFHIDTCPNLNISGFTGTIYAGAFAKIYGLEKKGEITAEIYWDFDSGQEAKATVLALNETEISKGKLDWQPLGADLPEWGQSNRLPIDNQFNAVLLPTSVFTEQTAAIEDDAIVENVTWIADPSIQLDDDKIIVLYALHDTEKPWHQSMDIAEIVKDGANPWSISRITDDDSSEFSPSIHKDEANQIFAAWSRVDGDVSSAQSPEDIVPYLEIVASFYDSITSSWGTITQLTDNKVTDRKPLAISFGTQKGILWIQNQGQAIVGNADSGDRLMYSAWNGSGWDTPLTLWSDQKGIIEYSFVSDDQGQGHVVFAVDEDGDLETNSDLELHYVATVSEVWQTAQRLTNDTIPDELPVLVNPGGNPILVWSSDGTITYSPLATWNPAAVYGQETLVGKAPSLDGISFPGGAAITYATQSTDGMDIFASFYDTSLDKWSLPRQLTHDEHSESSLSLAFDGTEIIISYLKTQTLYEDIETELNGEVRIIENVPQPGRTDIYVLRHALGHDLAADPESLIVDPVNPVPGTSATIQVSVDNRGDKVAQNVLVTFYDGDPDLGGELIDQTTIGSIIAGGTQEIAISWVVPSDLNAHNVFAVVDPVLSFDDRDRSNNATSSWAVLSDLVLETSHIKEISDTEVAITSKIINSGVIPSGRIKVHWRLESDQGTEIGYEELDSIAADSFRECTFVWDKSDYESYDGSVKVYTIVDADNEVMEADESNNSHVVAVGNLAIADTDGDNIPDYIEDSTGCLDPNDADTDDDGISDGDEDADHDGILGISDNETHPCYIDTDFDGIQDGTEMGVTEPVPDPDGDGALLGTDTGVFIPDADPSTTTDPLDEDSDNDDLLDGEEDENHNGRVDAGERDPNDESDRTTALPFIPLLLLNE